MLHVLARIFRKKVVFPIYFGCSWGYHRKHGNQRNQTKQSQRLFAANVHYPVAPKLALEAFGALRCSPVERIEKEHIRFEQRGIFMPAKAHKTGKRKYRQGHPENLWAWLAIATDATWALGPGSYDEAKREAFIRASVDNPGNILRHSCISYLLAKTKSFESVGYLAQHSNRATTENYEGIVENDVDTAHYFQIKP